MGYRDNHVATAGYLVPWASDGRLSVVTPPTIESELRKPRKVAYRRDFWGRDRHVRQAVERDLERIESDAVAVIRDLPDAWPLERGTTGWFALAYLVAVHLLRAPDSWFRVPSMQQTALRRQLPRLRDWTDGQVDGFVRGVTTDAWRAQLFAEQLRLAATLVGSMHWSLVKFHDALLATSDQPVTVVPLLAGSARAPITPSPPNGLTDCQEIRMALGPSEALVFTWLNQPDDGPAFDAEDELARELNRAVTSQADEQWFHHPSRRPTTLSPFRLTDRACRPVSPQLFPDYGYAAALESQRRLDTCQNLEEMIEHPVQGSLRIAGVRRAPA